MRLGREKLELLTLKGYFVGSDDEVLQELRGLSVSKEVGNQDAEKEGDNEMEDTDGNDKDKGKGRET